MLTPFFTLAAVSPSRQRTFRVVVAAHLAALTLALGGVYAADFPRQPVLFGNLLLVAGIVEGALLLGWRLTQLPKSQALEFLLVSPLRPPLVFVAEAAVGLTRLALVTLAGLPVLLLMAGQGLLYFDDLPTLLLLPYVWGAVCGLGLATWAYEPDGVRRWGERAAGVLIVAYLVVGVLAGEHLPSWVAVLPAGLDRQFLHCFRFFHEYNPFGVMKFAMEQPPAWTWGRVVWVLTFGLLLATGLLLRAAWRLQGHFHDEHYRPAVRRDRGERPAVGDRPLTWWAVKRVSRYAGRINLWLAGGFGLLYAAFTLAGDAWPAWLGRQIFLMVEGVGGIPVLATALVILATVPAAFQYGLWDSNAQDRCRRLELLLLTRLTGREYWEAAAAAAWQRGRGYFGVALLLWASAWWAGQLSWGQALASAAAGVVLWGFSFALGFRAFARGMQANALGLLLTLVLPLAVFLAYRGGLPLLALLLPPGSVFHSATRPPDLTWLMGPGVAGLLTLAIARWSLRHCDRELRRWYDLHHGTRLLD